MTNDKIDKLLTVRECAKILQISTPTFYRRVADGTFPKPIKIGGFSRWSEAEILAALQKLKGNRV